MLRVQRLNYHLKKSVRLFSSASISTTTSLTNAEPKVPTSADVVIIGGGASGCYALYHLTKRGVNAVLLERFKLTAGTTWHSTGGLWRLRPNDVDIQILASTRNVFMGLEKETGHDPGWNMNGGLFISHNDVRLQEYQRLNTLGKCFGIPSEILDPEEATKLFPLLDKNTFTGALYSPGDGFVDPTMLCTALRKAAIGKGGTIVENCTVDDFLIGPNTFGGRKINGIVTPYGTIKTNAVLNATGVWGGDLLEKHGLRLPLIPMKHAYITTQPIDGIKGSPNIRDSDCGIYFRIQGSAISMGGYEQNPVILDHVATDFNFKLYDMDWPQFENHVAGAGKLCPAFSKAGIKSTVCGNESFTPDHKPILGPDPRVDGLFHSCGYNSAGIMLGGGCGEQIAEWMIHGRPEWNMFAYDIRRFTEKQSGNRQWALERSHEAYATNYNTVFLHDQPLAGRNLHLDPLHSLMVENGAVMEQKQGWERPGYFLTDRTVKVKSYDWYGAYGNTKHTNDDYETQLKGELNFGFSDHHDLIGREAMACRSGAVVFNLSNFCKLYLTGTEAKEAVSWIFTENPDIPVNRSVYTCALNQNGGVEANVRIMRIPPADPHILNFDGDGYYLVAEGLSAQQTKQHIKQIIKNKKFNVKLTDTSEELGLITIQGPKSRAILQQITDCDLSGAALPYGGTTIADIKVRNVKRNVRILRATLVGELGYVLHIPKSSCVDVYNILMYTGRSQGLINAGYRALYSLGAEKGYHLWSTDLRPDDTPIEANIESTCRQTGNYLGKSIIDQQRRDGVKKRLAFFTLQQRVPLFGLEAIYRDGENIGFLRRGDYGYYFQKSIGLGYVKRRDGEVVDRAYIESGKYQIESFGRLYDADCFVKSPFDSEHKRVLVLNISFATWFGAQCSTSVKLTYESPLTLALLEYYLISRAHKPIAPLDEFMPNLSLQLISIQPIIRPSTHPLT